MKAVSGVDASVVREPTTTSPPIRVGMHVLGTAHTDMRVMRAATALVEAGFAVTVVDIEWKRSEPVEEDICGVWVKHIFTPNWYTARRFKPWFLIQAVWLLIRSTLLLLQTSADAYHAHDTKTMPACFLAARLRRKPLIFDAHELPLSNESETTHWRGIIRLFSGLLALMVPRCAGVITISPPIAQEIHKRYAGPGVTLIRNMPASRAVPKSDRLRHYLGLSTEVRIALYQGGLEASRGLDRLICAAPFLKQDIAIVLMGPDIEGIQPQLEALIHSERVTDRVKIVPSVPYAEILDWTASANIGLIIYAPDHSLNVKMCLPNKLFEYLMAGLPVLASQLDAVADIINTYDVGQIVSSLRPTDIAAAINTLVGNPLAYARMRRNALIAAQQELCWEKESHRLIHLYHEILAM
jgi:glycosyltransferase involved in cell wall biosynthesis